MTFISALSFLLGGLFGALVACVAASITFWKRKRELERRAAKQEAFLVRSAAAREDDLLRAAAERDRAKDEEQQRRREIFERFDVKDPANQLRFIEEASLYSRKPINREAFRTVFSIVERTLTETNSGYRLLAEVCMGSFLGTSQNHGTKAAQDRAFSSFNSKRVDFLIIDTFGKPCLVIEYQGSGHYQGDSEQRDMVKRMALKAVRVPLLEISEGTTAPDVARAVRTALGVRRGARQRLRTGKRHPGSTLAEPSTSGQLPSAHESALARNPDHAGSVT